jgi:hypothetical protein
MSAESYPDPAYTGRSARHRNQQWGASYSSYKGPPVDLAWLKWAFHVRVQTLPIFLRNRNRNRRDYVKPIVV